MPKNLPDHWSTMPIRCGDLSSESGGGKHRFYIKQFIFVHYASSFFTNLILSMKSVLLQRAQEDESSGSFFHIVTSIFSAGTK